MAGSGWRRAAQKGGAGRRRPAEFVPRIGADLMPRVRRERDAAPGAPIYVLYLQELVPLPVFCRPISAG
jgi:hypothetical protein